MAQTAQRERRTEDNNAQLTTLISQLTRPISAQHPTNCPTPEAQAVNLIRMDQLLDILRGSRPPATDPRRAVYDNAVTTLGEENVANAIAYVERSTVSSFNHLTELMRQPSANVGDSRTDFVAMLQRMDTGISNGDQRYAAFDPIGNVIASMLRSLRGGEVGAAPTQRDQTATRQELPIIQTQLRDLGPIHLLSTSNNQTVVTLNAQPTTVLNSLFGGEANATGALNSLANAYATMANHPNDLGAQQNAAHQLYTALHSIPSGREIWNSTIHPNFTAALNALNAGNLQQGLALLSQETAFNTVYGALNNLYTITVNQRSVAVLRGGVTVRYEFDRNQEAFTEFMRSAQTGNFQPRLLWMAMGLYYERLLVSGELTQYQVQQGTGGNAGGIRAVSSQRLTGTGDVFSVTPQVALGASAWGNPMEIVFHCNVGYQAYQLGTTVPTQGGGSQPISVGQAGAYIGVWGAEVRFPGREGQRSMIRMNRANIGAIGSPENFFASISFEGNWHEGNTLRIRSEVTPQYSHFLSENRVGAEVRPADFTIQVNPNWTLFFGPGFRYDFNATTGGHYLEGYGTLGFRFDRGVSVDLRAGALGEVGGPEGERVPTSAFGGLNLVITPETLFGRRRAAVPRREGNNP